MANDRFYILVNTHSPDGYRLCDEDGEVYFDRTKALQQRDWMRKFYKNPHLEVYEVLDAPWDGDPRIPRPIPKLCRKHVLLVSQKQCEAPH